MGSEIAQYKYWARSRTTGVIFSAGEGFLLSSATDTRTPPGVRQLGVRLTTLICI
jgi:hypothetical protein